MTNLIRIKKRVDYLAVASTRRKWVTSSFILQAKPPHAAQPDDDSQTKPAVGFTASKKVGNAVKRNRARRRLKAVAADMVPKFGQDGWQYILIARQAAVDYPFEALAKDLKWALAKLHAGADLKSGGNKRAANIGS